jgi:uncharacterized glyoxalase superfamily protein PhnB
MEDLRPSVTVGICYRAPRAALAWLEAAFGFETRLVIEGPDGGIAHSEMKVGEGLIMVGCEWDERHRSPASLGGVNTQSAHINLDQDIDAHCARARAAGAMIFREPEDQFYGERVYGAYDLEGHQWTFSRLLKTLSVEEMGQAGGVIAREHL